MNAYVPREAEVVSRIVTVSEEETAAAIMMLLEREKTLAEGADMVGVCRPIISEPDFPNIIFQSVDNPKARCISCNKCLLQISICLN